jgi:predicted RNase H-like nuclease (RuvC/YqgF family)
MTDNPLRSEINNLERKIILLLNEHKSLKNNVETLKRENQELRNIIKEKETILVNFQNQDKISKIVNGMVVGEGNASELVEVIDEYIKEVDKCIAHLSE